MRQLLLYPQERPTVAQYSVDPNNGGAFGLGMQSIGWGTIRVAAVDDNANTISIWTTVVP